MTGLTAAQRHLSLCVRSLRDECPDEEIFDSLADARRMLARWRYDSNNVRRHSSLCNKTPQKRAERLNYVMASRPARVPRPKPTIIKLKDSHYG